MIVTTTCNVDVGDRVKMGARWITLFPETRFFRGTVTKLWWSKEGWIADIQWDYNEETDTRGCPTTELEVVPC
jgi:hypothetical protein